MFQAADKVDTSPFLQSLGFRVRTEEDETICCFLGPSRTSEQLPTLNLRLPDLSAVLVADGLALINVAQQVRREKEKRKARVSQ